MDKKFLFIDFETYWSSRDYTLSKMGPVEMAKLGVPLIGNIHDAWLACVPESEADKTEAIMRRCMSMVPPYLEGLPVACDAEVGTDYTIA